jgi:outer membrane beta-barrel protein
MKALRLSLLIVVALSGVRAYAQSNESEAGDVSEVDKDALGPLRERVRPVSGNLFLKKGRFEFSPGVSVSAKDAFYTKYLLGLSLTYFPFETLGIGLRGGYSIPAVSGAAQICTTAAGTRGCKVPALEQLQQNSAPGEIQLTGGLDLQWAPIYGKISLSAEKFLHFDMYGVIGASAVQYGLFRNGAKSSNLTVGGNLGLGARFVANRWLAIRLELRDLIYSESGTGTAESLRSQIIGDVGVSIFLPTTFGEG